LDGTEPTRGVASGKRWYVVTADIDEAGIARGVRLDGPYADHETAEAKIEKQRNQL